MTENKKDDEATEKVNAPKPKEEESSSEKENLEDSKTIQDKPEEIAEDYLEEPKETIDYKKRYGDSTREYQELKKEAETHSQAIKNLEELARANPKIVEEIEAAQRLSGETNSTFVDQRINEAIEPVKKMAQELQNKDKLSKVKVLASFEKKNPDLFPSKATQEEKKEIRQTIGKVANALVETGMSFSKAVERAYLTVNPKAAVQKGKDKAYLEGLSEERAGFSSQSSTEGKKPKKSGYSKRELEIAEKMGVKKLMLKDKK